jgi:zinc-binding alcohol dehydrogenase/oxidoreductase
LGNLQEFKDLLAFCEQHQIRPVIDRVFPMEHVREALDVMSRAEQFGKIALTLHETR